MIYRVNLYQERGARASRIRRGVVRGTLLGLAIGVEILLIGFLVVSGFQIRERARQVEARLAGSAAAAEASPDPARADLARELIQLRVRRVDWTPMLEAAAGGLPPDIILSKIEGETSVGRGSRMLLNLEGRVTGSAEHLEPVIAYMQGLRDSTVITRTFPFVGLGTAQGDRGGFQIVCRTEETEEKGAEP